MASQLEEIVNLIEEQLKEYDGMYSWHQTNYNDKRVKLEKEYKILTGNDWVRKEEDRGKWVGCCYETEAYDFCNN